MKKMITEKISITALTLLLAASVTFLPGCGKVAEVTVEKMVETTIEQSADGNAQVDINSESGSITMQMKDGDNTINMQTGESVPLPADFPSDVPIPEGTTWMMVQTSTGEGGNLMLQGTVGTAMAELAATLKSQAEAQGWESIQNISQGGQMEMMTFSKGEQTLSYTLGNDNGKTTVMVVRG
jgi:hypothetical protein